MRCTAAAGWAVMVGGGADPLLFQLPVAVPEAKTYETAKLGLGALEEGLPNEYT
jgi:hypothetical protein